MTVRPESLDAAGAAVPGWRHASGTVYSAGQPAPDHWTMLATAGVRSVLNLRPAGEQPSRDEAAEVAAAGMVYAALPIKDTTALGRHAALALDQHLRKLPRPLLVHCASGNRVGALLALREAWFNSVDPDAAIARGRAAGLTGLEPAVRGLLGLP